MTGHDDEFEDFLRRKRPIFTRSGEEPLEPPAELDRLILRQARDAIQQPKPQRVFRAPGWGMPVALAATLVLAFTVILHTVNTPKPVAAEVAVQTVARSVESAPAAAPEAELAQSAAPYANYSANAAPAARSDGVFEAAVVEPPVETEADKRAEAVADAVSNARVTTQAAGDRALVAREEGTRYADSPPAPILTPSEQSAPASASVASKAAGGAYAPAQTDMADAAPRKAPGLAPTYRRDSKTWLAEIERLRATGDAAQADAELVEFKRQHRAYATSPDR